MAQGIEYVPIHGAEILNGHEEQLPGEESPDTRFAAA
jgi:hypothetical protein